MKKLFALLLASAFALALSTATIAKPAHKADFKEAVSHNQEPCEETFSKEQVAKILEVKSKYAPEFDRLKDAMFVKKEVLRALQSSTNPDVKQVEAVANEIVELRKQRRELRKKMKAEIGFLCPKNMRIHEKDKDDE